VFAAARGVDTRFVGVLKTPEPGEHGSKGIRKLPYRGCGGHVQNPACIVLRTVALRHVSFTPEVLYSLFERFRFRRDLCRP
jgi:hypothetical protein